MDDIQKVDNNYGQVAQVVYGDQNFTKKTVYYINISQKRNNFLTMFCNVRSLWHIEIDYHFRLLYHYHKNSDYILNFIVAITDFDMIYFNDIFYKKLDLYNISKEIAIKRFRQLHKDLFITEDVDIFLRSQFDNSFNNFFIELPEETLEKENILLYGIYAIVYFHILNNNKDDKYLHDICYFTLKTIRESNYKILDQTNIIQIALDRQKILLN